MRIITYLRSHIVSAVLAVLFIISAYFFSATRSAVATDEEKLRALTSEVRLLRVQQNEVHRTLAVVNKTRSFVDHSKSLGLERESWNTYKVDIQEPTTLRKAGQILDQTANTEAYLFKPQKLHMSLLGETPEETSPGKPSRRTPAAEAVDKNDILLQLKGAFLVKK